MIHHRTKRVIRPWPKPIYGLPAQRRSRRQRAALHLLVMAIVVAALLVLVWFATEPYVGR